MYHWPPKCIIGTPNVSLAPQMYHWHPKCIIGPPNVSLASKCIIGPQMYHWPPPPSPTPKCIIGPQMYHCLHVTFNSVFIDICEWLSMALLVISMESRFSMAFLRVVALVGGGFDIRFSWTNRPSGMGGVMSSVTPDSCVCEYAHYMYCLHM